MREIARERECMGDATCREALSAPGVFEERFHCHLASGPVLCRRRGVRDASRHQLLCISFEAMCFSGSEPYEEGETIEVVFPLLSELQPILGRIAWRKILLSLAESLHVHRLVFGQESLLLRARMIEEICHSQEALSRSSPRIAEADGPDGTAGDIFAREGNPGCSAFEHLRSPVWPVA